VPVADICRKAGISQTTYFNWKRKYDGLLPTEMRRLKQLEEENGKLKKLVAELSLDREMLQDVIRRKLWGLFRKRKLVDAGCGEWDVFIRRACRVLQVDTSTYHYKSRRPGQAGLEHRIKEICQTRVRYGYRRVDVLLRREGWPINQKKTRRIYRELGLQLRNKTPKRRVKAKAARGSQSRHAANRDLGNGLRT
jgi:putative transposase